MKLQRRTVAVISIAITALCLGVAGVVTWRVEKALSNSRRETAASELLGVEARAVGAQPIPASRNHRAAVFKSVAAFQGKITSLVRLVFMFTRTMHLSSTSTEWGLICPQLPWGRWP